MSKFSIRSLCEGAVVTALTVFLLTAGLYFPIFRLFTVFIGGIPLMYLIIKRGVYVSAVSFIASMLLLFALTGNFISGPLSCFITLLPAVAAGYCMGHDFKYYQTLLAVVVSVIFGYLVDIMILNAMADGGNIIENMLDESMTMMKDTINGYLTDVSDGDELSGMISDMLNQTKYTVLSYFPTILLIISGIVGYIITSVCIFFAGRLRIKKYSYVKFSKIKAPRSMCIAAVVLMLITFLSNDDTVYTLALKNVTAILIFILSVDGMSLVDYALSKKVKSGYKRALIYLVVILAGYLFISVIFYILMFIGMLDANLDIRLLKRAGDNSEDQ